jgi:hypothetical protein
MITFLPDIKLTGQQSKNL